MLFRDRTLTTAAKAHVQTFAEGSGSVEACKVDDAGVVALATVCESLPQLTNLVLTPNDYVVSEAGTGKAALAAACASGRCPAFCSPEPQPASTTPASPSPPLSSATSPATWTCPSPSRCPALRGHSGRARRTS